MPSVSQLRSLTPDTDSEVTLDSDDEMLVMCEPSNSIGDRDNAVPTTPKIPLPRRSDGFAEEVTSASAGRHEELANHSMNTGAGNWNVTTKEPSPNSVATDNGDMYPTQERCNSAPGESVPNDGDHDHCLLYTSPSPRDS